ncbi:4Fe-4S dicluster domain-containing protein [Natranaerofaba carboxydovora]|uniref:4Fe-4S dicluster domain-containing protein n=1 Tax=Natranaerofaba carboxydovora TaxID=2742683 RepID=UPI001F13EE3A|nr:4Fe-4S dicluster domain-containing protein [Natranaerofaba carboxydovora]UMZ75464.1 Anaerobic sulfite reductase subunit A [Natranaerofaba carboxydovora]
MKLTDIKKVLEEAFEKNEKLEEKYNICDGEKENIKSFFFPQTEKYLEFKRTDKGTEFFPVNNGLVNDSDGTGSDETDGAKEKINVVVRAKPCSVEALEVFDYVFLSEPVDPLYKEKREKTIIISSSCRELKNSCFCTSVGIDPYKPVGGDVRIDDSTGGVVGVTPKGKDFLEEIFEADESKKSEIQKLEVDQESDLEKGNVKTSTEREAEKDLANRLKDKLDNMQDSKLWDELSLRCLGCGVCTYYCPSCHCFDVCDYYKKDTGSRYRAWDSCMFSEFTSMAGGHNPRPTKKDRIKNRFYHKFNYLPKLYEKLGCVGCGKCLVHCPVGISPLTLLREMGEIEDEDKSISTS